MKKLIFLASIFYILFGGGNHLYANISKDKICSKYNGNIIKNKHLKSSEEDKNVLIFDEITIDFEEDLNDFKSTDSNKNNLLVIKNNFLQNWYNSNSIHFNLNISNKRFEIFSPFSGYSNPIYISIQVLRI
jgi:hypothetical protein